MENTFIEEQLLEDHPMKALTVCYSTYGHVHKMAEAVAEGVNQVDGAEAVLRRVLETLPEDVLNKMGAVDTQQVMSHMGHVFKANMSPRFLKSLKGRCQF